MSEFDGGSFEPVVGSIYALRTFALADDGALLPVVVNDAPSWVDGENVAVCIHYSDHAAPVPGCTCGYYAYSAPSWLEYAEQGAVQAVVECYGRVIAGTRGLKAQKVRLAALWLSRAVPEHVRQQVEARYPSTRLYRSKQEMLLAHPLTRLDCHLTPPTPLTTRLWTTTPVVATVIGVLTTLLLLARVPSPGFAAATPFLLLAGAMVPLIVQRQIKHGAVPVVRGPRVAFGLSSGLVGLGCWFLNPEGAGRVLTLAIACPLAAAAAISTALGWWHHRGGVLIRPRSRTLAALEPPVGASWLLDGGPQVAQGHLVHALTCGDDRAMFVQTVNVDQNLYSAFLAGQQVARNSAVPVLVSDTGTGVTVVVPHPSKKYVASVPMPLIEVAQRLRLPAGIWHPPSLRVDVKTMAAPTVDGRPRKVYHQWPGRIPIFEDQQMQAALHDALVTAEKTWYRNTQALIAKAGVAPASIPALSGSTRQAPEVIAQGWSRLLRMSSPNSLESVAALYLTVKNDLPEVARITPTVYPVSDAIGALRDITARGGAMETTTVAHRVMLEEMKPAITSHGTDPSRWSVVPYSRNDGAILGVCVAEKAPEALLGALLKNPQHQWLIEAVLPD